MKVIVPDASVLLKWIISSAQEPDTEKALLLREAAVREDLTLKVPSLWIFEVGNFLAREFPSKAEALLQTLIDFQLEEVRLDEKWLDSICLLTSRFNVTFYDAAYHALAIHQKGVFVTADEKYAKKTVRAGSIITLAKWAL